MRDKEQPNPSAPRAGPDLDGNAPADRAEHITVCVCTYKRPELLRTLLEKLEAQETAGRFTFSVVVVDNDAALSARDTVKAFAAKSGLEVEYHCEPEQNIALARNRALLNAKGEYVALIDDDEYPIASWLQELRNACLEMGADGVQGPVVPKYEEGAPPWVIKGRLYEKPLHPRGHCLAWPQGMTGNLFLRRSILGGGACFDPAYGSGGEDLDFFRRMISRGHTFRFCPEAVVYEFVPHTRWRESFLLKRALLRGKVAILHPSFGAASVFKSAMAVAAYTLFLPFSLLLGKHVFMKYLVREFDHLGKILAFCRLDIIREKYITE